MSHRVVANISPQAKKSLEDICEDIGMSQKECHGRIIDWFVKQNRSVQLFILDILNEGTTPDIIDFLAITRIEKVKMSSRLSEAVQAANLQLDSPSGPKTLRRKAVKK